MYEVIKIITYQFYTYVLVEELKKDIEKGNREDIELFLSSCIDKDISTVNGVFQIDFKSKKDVIDKQYNLKSIYEFIDYWEKEHNILKKFKGEEKKFIPYYLNLLRKIYLENICLDESLKEGYIQNISFLEDSRERFYFEENFNVKDFYKKVNNAKILEYFKPEYKGVFDKNKPDFQTLSSIEQKKVIKDKYSAEQFFCDKQYKTNYLFVVELIKALSYEYACESMEDYFNGVDNRGPIEKLMQEHTFEEIGKIMGFEHLEGDAFIKEISKLATQRDTSTERRKFAKGLLDLLKQIRYYYLEDKDPYLLKGYKTEDYFENSPKFEDDVLREIALARSYLEVLWNKMLLPKDIAQKFHSRLVKDYVENTGATDF